MTTSWSNDLTLLEKLINSGGPTPNDYHALVRTFQRLQRASAEHPNVHSHVQDFIDQSDGAFNSTDTMQGFVCCKPHGYHGDFEIIDRIYQNWISPKDELKNWDRFFHWGAAPSAVRNRKDYFKTTMTTVANSLNEPPKLLNIACGPGRDVGEWLVECKPRYHKITMLDHDVNALTCARQCLLPFDRIEFLQRNVFRWKNFEKYDVIWCAGLFDYLDQRAATHLLSRMYSWLSDHGVIIIGNFSRKNTSREYMEFGGWNLIHRSAPELLELTKLCKIQASACSIEQEPLGVNLFLHVHKTATTLMRLHDASAP